MQGLQLYSYGEIIEKCDVNDKEIMKDILCKYELFKEEVEKQINNDSQKFIEINCNGHIYRNILLIYFWDKKIKLMKDKIKKIEYFKGYSSAVRIELDNEVYFINASIDDVKLANLMNDLFKI